jgi:hypothetical protein
MGWGGAPRYGAAGGVVACFTRAGARVPAAQGRQGDRGVEARAPKREREREVGRGLPGSEGRGGRGWALVGRIW